MLKLAPKVRMVRTGISFEARYYNMKDLGFGNASRTLAHQTRLSRRRIVNSGYVYVFLEPIVSILCECNVLYSFRRSREISDGSR